MGCACRPRMKMPTRWVRRPPERDRCQSEGATVTRGRTCGFPRTKTRALRDHPRAVHHLRAAGYPIMADLVVRPAAFGAAGTGQHVSPLPVAAGQLPLFHSAVTIQGFPVRQARGGGILKSPSEPKGPGLQQFCRCDLPFGGPAGDLQPFSPTTSGASGGTPDPRKRCLPGIV